EEPLDEPDRGTAGEGLELGDAEHRALAERLQDGRVGEPRRPVERAERALEAGSPALGARERAGGGAVRGREPGQRTDAPTVGRRAFDRPDQGGESPAR